VVTAGIVRFGNSERTVFKDRVTAQQSQRIGAIRRSSRAGMGLLFHRDDSNGDLIVANDEKQPGLAFCRTI
jgi:hypothetical protein